MDFSKMTLGTRIGTGFGAVIAILALAIFWGVMEMNKLGRLQDESHQRALGLEELDSLKGDVGGLYSMVGDLVINKNYSELEAEWQKDMEKISGEILRADAIVDTGEERRALSAFKTGFASYRANLERMIAHFKAGGTVDDPSLRAIDERADGEVRELMALLTRITESLKAEMVESDRVFDEERRQTANIQYGLLALSVCLGALVAYLIVRTVKREVGGEPRNIRIFAQKIADGNLTMASMDDSKVTGISQAVGRMNNSLKQLIFPMSEGMSKLSSFSVELTNVAGELRRGASESASRASSVAASAEEMHANLSSVAAAVEQTNANVTSVAAAAEELTATINEISQRATNAHQTSENAVTVANEIGIVIDQLARAADEIGKVTDTITGISDQTKLLALNATIEAARAGEAGKGFAVVASEIKELARQAADATGDIASRIQAIRSATDKTRAGIGEMSDVILGVNEAVLSIASAVEEQSITVRDIARNAQEVSGAVADSSHMVAETSVAASEVAKDIALLNSETESLAATAGMVDTSAESLKAMAAEMKGLVSRFSI